MSIYSLLLEPFLTDGAMSRALVACAMLAISGAPLGVFLVLRRMSLMGDALSHGILSGVAIAFVVSAGAFWPMLAGGLLAGIAIASLSALIARYTPLKEDASFASLYMISLALAMVMMSASIGHEQIEAALFGNILAMKEDALTLMIAIGSLTLVALALLYRGIVIDCFDPTFMRSLGKKSVLYHQCFLALVVMNLVASFHAMGMLMALGLITLPAITAQLWSKHIDGLVVASVLLSFASGVSGLLLSYHAQLPSGPSIVLAGGALYIFSVLFGRTGGIMSRFLPHRHFTR